VFPSPSQDAEDMLRVADAMLAALLKRISSRTRQQLALGT